MRRKCLLTELFFISSLAQSALHWTTLNGFSGWNYFHLAGRFFFIFVAHKTRPLSAILSCLPSIFQKKWEKNQRKECKNWERAGMTSLICAWALQCASTGWLFMTWTSNPRRIQLPWWDVFLWGFRLCKSDLSITYCQKCAMLGEPQQPRMRILNRPVNVLHSVVDAPVDP